ncbi:hypothetical protein [Bacilliculturomica massiliensis]|uniref:hypothetical protein n=1 Tax=Bacilliculturomica massiliensis TaxID=1917867 RepID=UPI0010316A98|nr:hypothetical protein [Bacilliculturomica massiliensis]
MKNRSNMVTLCAGVITMAVTALIFILNFGLRAEISKTGLGFMLLAEAVFFGGLLLTGWLARRGCGIMLRSGGYSLLTLYAAASILLSVLFLNSFRGFAMLLTSLQIVLLAAAVILYLIIWHFSRRTGEKTRRIQQAGKQLRELVSRSELLADEFAGEKQAAGLREIAEALRCSDPGEATDIDRMIGEELERLDKLLHSGDESSSSGADETIVHILSLIRQRGAQLKNSRSGGI